MCGAEASSGEGSLSVNTFRSMLYEYMRTDSM